MIEKSTGVRSLGWSSPSVYPDARNLRAPPPPKAFATLSMRMDSDTLSRLGTLRRP